MGSTPLWTYGIDEPKGMKENYSLEELYVKAANYCAYQERSHQDVLKKLKQLEASSSDSEKIIDRLYDENFLNDERFALSFTRGHFEYKKWGKNKIGYALRAKGVNNILIEKALEQIEENKYLEVLETLLIKKKNSLKAGLSKQEEASKVWNYAASKGFESGLIRDIWNEIISNEQDVKR